MNILRFGLIKGQLKLVNLGIQFLQLLCAQELLLLLWHRAQSIDLFGLDLADIPKCLILAEEHIDLLLVLRVLVGDLGAVLLGTHQLLLYLLHHLLVPRADRDQLLLVGFLVLQEKFLVALCSLSYDFLKLDDELFTLLKLGRMLVLFADEESLQLTLFIVVLVNDRVALRLELGK